MLPTQSKYPEYVADQLLTADNLNDAFDYLEEGERLTRANLIGIGIVCGLEVRAGTAPDGSPAITITAGCGITSAGYLVEVPEQTYTRYKTYKPLTEITYDRFVTASPAAERFHIDELVLASSGEGIQTIDNDFMKGKLVLLYVELLLKKVRNCDPESCDDKGAGITVTFRPLVVNAAAQGIESLLDKNGVGEKKNGSTLIHTTPLALPRVDVPASELVDADEILNAFYLILQGSFPGDLADNIQTMGKALAAFMDKDYGSPAQQLTEQMDALRQNGPDTAALLLLPYYYDYLSDLFEAWNELRETFEALIGECCPDGSRFPRHLLLGLTDGTESAKYRTGFIPSPATGGGSLWLARLRSLWARLCALVNNFNPPQPQTNENGMKLLSPLRITPSRYGITPLSERAIPFYYDLQNGNFSLPELWNDALTRRRRINTILGYSLAALENALPQVAQPLRYDLEPYNFLRIEGASGMPYSTALRDIGRQIQQYRLPIEVIALRAGAGDGPEVFGPDLDCYFEDLQLNYELVRREVEAVFGKTLEYLNGFEALPGDLIDRGYPQPRFAPFRQNLINIKQYFVPELRDFIGSYTEFIQLYTSIEQDAQAFREKLFYLLEGRSLKNRDVTHYVNSDIDYNFIEDLIDHLDNIVMCCEKGGLRAVYQQYAKKAETLYSKLFFGDFIQEHPGVQHKAGVTIGGTFILVYTPPVRVSKDNFLGNDETANAPGASGARASETLDEQSAAAAPPVVSRRANGEHNIKPHPADFGAAEFYRKRLEREDSNILTEAARKLSGGIVIADFFLPYRVSQCCGDSVTFIVNDAEPPERLSIEIGQSDFCNGAEMKVPVAGLPEGGELKGQGIEKAEDGKSYVFNPAGIKLRDDERMRDVLLTYSKGNSRPVHATIRVYARPEVDFGVFGTMTNSGIPVNPISDDDEFSGVVSFASLSKNAGHLNWSLDDGKQIQYGAQATFDFSEMRGKRSLTLSGKNGPCEGEMTKQLNLVTPGIFLEPAEYCMDSAARPVLDVHPKGGTAYSSETSAPGVVYQEGDAWKFNPTLVHRSENFFTTVTLYYNAPDGRQYSTQVKVYQAVQATRIDKSVQADGLTWNFTAGSAYAQNWDWTFGPNGEQRSGAQVSYKFPEEPGDYSVQVILSNGPCSVTLNDKVTIGKTRKACLPLADIISDFTDFDKANREKFSGSTSYEAIVKFFTTLRNFPSDIEGQLEGFTRLNGGDRLAEWLRMVSGEIANFQASSRPVFIQEFSILLRTAFYIACIQTADLKLERVSVVAALQTVQTGIRNDWQKAWSVFSNGDKKATATLSKTVQREADQVKASGENATKPEYLRALTDIVDAIRTLK